MASQSRPAPESPLDAGPSAPGAAQGKTFLGHPRGLYVLFFTEMWERFSYYGMRALLIFYLIQHWMFSEAAAYGIYGTYGALVYLTPVIGGYVADHYLGQRKAVQFGAVLLVVGHGLMAIEGDGGADSAYLNLFWLSLAFIIMGVGFLKASISAIVGELYAQNDIRRDSAFTIFYMGINLGAALGAILAGYLGQTYGWSYGFGAAGIGMLLGLVVFLIGRPWLMGQGESRKPEWLARRSFGLSNEWRIYLLGVGGVGVVWLLIQSQGIIGWLLIACAVLAVGYFLYEAVVKLDKISRDRIFAALFLIALQPLFWSLYEQAGSSLNVYTDRSVDRDIFGWVVPASIFQSMHAIYIILLGPFFVYLWTWLGRRGLDPSTPAKFGLALIQLGAGFLVLVFGAQSSEGLTPIIFIFLIYLLHTTGELCLSPVGLSAMTKLAPSRLVGLLIGVWFLSSAGGNYLGGLIAQATGGHGSSAANEGGLAVLSVYDEIGYLSIGVGVVVLMLSPFVKKLMHPGVPHQG